MLDEDKAHSYDRAKIIKESLRKALKLTALNTVLLEPRFIAMVVAVFNADDSELASEFNQHLKKSGRLTNNDREELDKYFWNWLRRNFPEQFISTEGEKSAFSGDSSLQHLSEALKEELEEKFGKQSEIKIQHAKDQILKELSKEFALKIKEIVASSGETNQSLKNMDEIIEKGGKRALNLLSDHIENARDTTNSVMNNAEIMEARVKKLEEEIKYDTIPGLYTVRVFSQKFQEMVDQFNGQNIPFSLAFLTTDKLDEQVSSSDPIISRKIFLGVAQQIIAELQNYAFDIVPARYDANLMGILLSQTELDEALKFANEIRTMTENHKFSTKSGTTLNLTVSAGIAEYSHRDSFWFDDIPGGGKQLSSTIINRAIEMLKKAQSKGGNRVEKEKNLE